MKFHLLPADLLKSETKLKIVKFLLSHEAAMSEREIASILNLTEEAVIKNIKHKEFILLLRGEV